MIQELGAAATKQAPAGVVKNNSGKNNIKFLLVMSGAVLCLGCLPLLEKLAVDSGGGLLSLVLSINLTTTVILLVPAWRKRPSALQMRWKSLLLIGGLASGLVVVLNLAALQTTSATHRSVFQAMYPAATVFFALWLLQERLPAKSYFVIFTMTLGAILMSLRGLRGEFVFGDLLLFFTLPVMGFCDVWVKHSLHDLQPAWVAFGRFAFGTLFLVAVGPLFLEWSGWPESEALLWVVLSGFTISAGIVLLYRGMDIKGAALAAALVSLSPVLTLLLEWRFTGARFNFWEIVGMLVVINGGVLLSCPAFQGKPRSTVQDQ